MNLNFVKNITKSIEASTVAKNTCPPIESKAPPPQQSSPKVAKKLQRLKMLQEKFQLKNGIPVFIKNGPRDKMLFQLTNVLAALGVLMSFYTIYAMAFDAHLNTEQRRV